MNNNEELYRTIITKNNEKKWKLINKITEKIKEKVPEIYKENDEANKTILIGELLESIQSDFTEIYKCVNFEKDVTNFL